MNLQSMKFFPQNFFQDKIEDILCDIHFVKKGRKTEISNVASVFDIEATSFYKGEEKQCCMYAWTFGINGKSIRGRTWEEFFEALQTVIDFYGININRRFIIYVHNLAYEFQFFKRYFEWENVFSMDTRKPIYAITKSGIEFRCSYLLSGYSLAKLGENLTKYKVKKMVGDLDYSLLRHSKTPLTDKEWGYVLNDGLVVMCHIQEEIERCGSIAELPITKTGYVRQLCREHCFTGKDKFVYTKLMKSLTLTVDDYKQLKRTYMGGFTHANINYVGETVDNVGSYDFTSSYPAVMLSERYPMSKPFTPKVKNEADFLNILHSFCCMFDVKFKNLRSKCNFENYISYSRCSKVEHFTINNGRIVAAENILCSLTEQDFFIIKEMYEWDEMNVYNLKCYYKGYLPKDIVETILDLYEKKTTLKGVEGKEVEYLVSKGMLNSCYGMCVTDPCREEIEYDNNDIWSVRQPDTASLLDQYNRNNQRFLYYPWGVWVTAYARRNLFSGILEFKDDYIYSDTDSIKAINCDKHQKYIDEYNKTITEKVNKCFKYYNIPQSRACPLTKKGVKKPIGVWDFEGTYNRFKTLGAKRYITETDGNLSITIAGVSKEAGTKFLKNTYGSNDRIFDHFKENLYFPSSYGVIDPDTGEYTEENGSGKNCHTYIDDYMDGELTDYLGNKYIYNEQSGVHLEATDYTLSLDREFLRLIMGIKGDYLI